MHKLLMISSWHVLAAHFVFSTDCVACSAVPLACAPADAAKCKAALCIHCPSRVLRRHALLGDSLNAPPARPRCTSSGSAQSTLMLTHTGHACSALPAAMRPTSSGMCKRSLPHPLPSQRAPSARLPGGQPDAPPSKAPLHIPQGSAQSRLMHSAAQLLTRMHWQY